MCAGGKVTLNFSGADSYSWSSIDGIISSDNSSVIVSPVSNTTYILNGKDNSTVAALQKRSV